MTGALPNQSEQPATSPSCCRWALPAILLLGAALRGAVLLLWGAHLPLHIADEQDYHRLATNLLTRHEFAIHADQPCSSRPPLFPLLVAGIYGTCGQENLLAVRVMQGGLSLILIWQTYLLGLRLFDRRTGLLAAGITSVYPSLVAYTTFFLSEILFSVLLLAGLLAVQRHWKNGSWLWLAAGGLWLGLATLARSVLWPCWPILGLYILFAEPGNWGRRIAAAAVLMIGFAVPLAPWTWRNWELEKTLIVVDTLGGRNMMMGNYEHTLEYRAWDTILVRGENSWDHMLLREHANYNDLTQGQRDKLAMSRGIQYVKDHPAVFARRSLIKFCNFWQLEREIVAGLADGRWGSYPAPVMWIVAGLIFGCYSLCLLLGVCGFLVLPSTERQLHWLIFLIVTFVCAVHTVVFAHSRYHLSLMPLIFPYTASAALRWRELWSARWKPSFLLAGFVCAFLVGSWIWQSLFVEGERIRQWITG